MEYKTGGATGRFLAFWTALVRSGFAFILSPELVAITAGESQSPRRNIPKASRRFIWRLMFFYCLGSLVITILVASNDPNLIQAVSNGVSNAGASPFVLGIQNAGMQFIANEPQDLLLNKIGIPVLNHIISKSTKASQHTFPNFRRCCDHYERNERSELFPICRKSQPV